MRRWPAPIRQSSARASCRANDVSIARSIYCDGPRDIGVHTTPRISALACGGETLVSSTVKDLVVGSGLRFTDRGSHQLKGVPGEWHLFAVEG